MRVFIAVLVSLLASHASAYTLRAIQSAPATAEADGQVFVAIQLERDVNDVGACSLAVDMSVSDSTNPQTANATGGVDYQPQGFSEQVALGANDTTAEVVVTVVVNDDAIREPAEVFLASIDSVSPVVCDPSALNVDPPGVILIADDDASAITVSLVPTLLSVDESAGTAQVQVQLANPASVQPPWSVNVDFASTDGSAQAGSDYTATTGTLTFNETTTSQTITVPIVDDPDVEGDETFDIVISNTFGDQPQASPFQVPITAPTSTVTIQDNDAPAIIEFTAAAVTVSENGGSITLDVTRTGSTQGAVTVDFATADGSAAAGSDYTAASGTLSWADGEGGVRSVQIPILDDADQEGAETFTATLSNLTGTATLGNNATATVTVLDDDGATIDFVEASVTVREEDGSVIVAVRRTGSATGAVSVDFATEDGTAIAGEDYTATSGTLVWADGDTTDKAITIELIDDTNRESEETFTIEFSNLTGPATLGRTSFPITISASEFSRDISGIQALTPNQRSLAIYLDDICPRLEAINNPTAGQQDLSGICTNVREPTVADGEVADALDAINPDELIFTAVNALRLTAIQHGNVSQRLNALRNGATGIDLAGLTVEIDGQALAGNVIQEAFDGFFGGGASSDNGTSPWGKWGGFLNGRYNSGDKDATSNQSGFDFDVWGLTAGADYRIRQNFIVGAAIGYGEVDADYQGSAGGLDIESWSASAFLTYFRDSAFYLDALATYGANDYDSNRRILFSTSGTTVDRIANGATDGNQFSIGIGSGFDFNRGALTFGPHFGSYYFDVNVDGFDEIGSGGLSLSIEDQNTESLTVNVGGHVSWAINTDWGVLVPSARIDWVHEFKDNRELLRYQFLNDPFVADASDPSPQVVLQSDRPDPNYLIWSVGLSTQLIRGFSGYINYQSYAGYRDVSLDEVSFGMRWEKTF